MTVPIGGETLLVIQNRKGESLRAVLWEHGIPPVGTKITVVNEGGRYDVVVRSMEFNTMRRRLNIIAEAHSSSIVKF